MPERAVADGVPGTARERVREGLPAGSLRHFAVLFSGSPDRPLLEAIYAFESELRRVLLGASHEAAHARLVWWRGELDRLSAGRPSHPLALALLPLRGRRDVDLALLHELLVAADLDMARLTYQTWPELEAYLYRSTGAVQTLLAATLAGDRGLAPGEREFARRLGAAVRQAEILNDLDRDLAHGRLYAPMQPLQHAGIDPHAFARNARDPASVEFLGAWRDRVHTELEDLPALLGDSQQRSTQRHGLVLAALHARWLARMDDKPASRNARPGLPPFSRLWTAWRTALRHA